MLAIRGEVEVNGEPVAVFKEADGENAVLLNWSEGVNGAGASALSATSFEDLVVATELGENAEEIVARLAQAGTPTADLFDALVDLP